jgi:predicted aspartyl protease
MGVFSISIQAAHPQNLDRNREVEVIVDTGATLTKLPAELLRELDIAPQFSVRARTSEDREIRRPVGLVRISIDGESGIVPVAFGDPGEISLLGATSLEILGFGVDPVGQKLTVRPLREK